jgi:ubiquinone/menaquinone biosynthesis C-methylase UbiE
MTDLWTKRYFDTMYLRRWALGPPGEAEYRHVDFLLGRISAVPGDTLLDVGCGQGRYSLSFADRGMRVTGLDASPRLLREARGLAHLSGTELRWVLGDMRSLPFTCGFKVAILFDSFGFFDTEADNEAVIHEMARVVVPGGHVVLAVVNGPRILNAFEPHGHEERDGRSVAVQRELDTSTRVVREMITVEEDGAQYSAERRQRLYSSTELADTTVRAGLTVQSMHGDLAGGPFDEATSVKIVMICGRGDGQAESDSRRIRNCR